MKYRLNLYVDGWTLFNSNRTCVIDWFDARKAITSPRSNVRQVFLGCFVANT